MHTALLSLESICYARMTEMCNIFAKNLAKEIRGPDGDDSRKMFAADFPVTLSLQLTNAALFGIATAGGSTFLYLLRQLNVQTLANFYVYILYVV